MFLLHQVSYVRQKSHLASLLDSLGYLALILKRVAGETTWKHLALVVEELLKELCILIIDVLNAELLEAAVFLLAAIHTCGAEVLYIVLLSHCLIVFCE
jgi:hypothetical protein